MKEVSEPWLGTPDVAAGTKKTVFGYSGQVIASGAGGTAPHPYPELSFKSFRAGSVTLVGSTVVARSYGANPTATLDTATGSVLPIFDAFAIDLRSDYTLWPRGDAPIINEQVRSYYSGSGYLSSTRRSFAPWAHPDYAGRLYSQTSPDGAKVSASYVRGTFVDRLSEPDHYNETGFTAGAGDARCETYLNGSATNVGQGAVAYSTDSISSRAVDTVWLVPWKSTRRQVIYNESGQQVLDLNFIFNGTGFNLIGWEKRTYRFDGTLETRQNQAGERVVTDYAGARLSSETSPGGVRTIYGYDVLGRVTTKTLEAYAGVSPTWPDQAGVTDYFTLDAVGRITVKNALPSNSPANIVSSSTYDLAGRLKTDTDTTGAITTYAYTNGGRITTATLATGATVVTEKYFDGTVRSKTGSAVVAEYYSRTVNADGTVSNVTRVGSENSARYTKSTMDWLGRPIAEEKPSPSGSGTYQATKTYNSKGQLVCETETGLAPRYYTYLSTGESEYVFLDINLNVTMSNPDATVTPDLAGDDRVTKTDEQVVALDGGYWRRKRTYTLQSGSSSFSQLSETLSKLVPFNGTGYANGVAGSEVRATDLFGNQTISTSVTDPSKRLVTTTVNVPDSSVDEISYVRNGQLLRKRSAENLTYEYVYDGHGRLLKTTDPRTDSSTTPRAGYYVNSQAAVGSRNQIAWREDSAGNRTNYTYDSYGRLYSTTDPLGKVTYQRYNDRGQVIRVWGSGTYPVEYEYNSLGERTKMRTFGNSSVDYAAAAWGAGTYPSTTGDLTTWAFDPATGVLTGKTDAKNKTVSYTYNGRGQLATRTWARGVTTTYAYSPTTAEQTGIDYSDSTADLAYTYNRLGQSATITDVTGLRTLEHCLCGKLTKDILPSSYFGNRIVSYALDTTGTGTKGRTVGLRVGDTNNPALEQEVTYGYDTYGRFQTLSVTGGPAFTYAYTPNSNLIGSITEASGWSEVNAYEPNRDLLTSVTGTFGAANKATFGYAYDAAGRRTQLVESGEMFQRYPGSGIVTKWTYNDRSEVTGAQSYFGTNPADLSNPVQSRNFAYDYDAIGNRKSHSVDGRQTTYAPNELNQYTSRTGSGYFNLTGFAPASASAVYAAGVAAQRQGDFFRQEFKTAWATTPQYWGLQIGQAPLTKSLDNVYSANWQGQPVSTPTVTGPTGTSKAVLEFGGTPNHVLIDAAQHGYTFVNGRTYTFGFWARTLSGTRTIDVALTDDINDGTTSATHTIGTEWKWVSVTKTYATVGANPRAFYTRSVGGGPFQASGAMIVDLTNGEGWNQGVYVGPIATSYTYDEDGNLLTDDRWSYTWDAENRLVEMTSRDVAYNNGVPRQRIQFKYDYLGRRVSKLVANWSGSDYVASLHRKFVYDGWNLIAEYNALAGNTPVQRYHWGLDLTRTMQDGGGVGGLLALVDESTGQTHLPHYDGNGNVRSLVDRATGVQTAAYEYSAFGETIRASGAAASTKPVRFSTKYTDDESGLIYYGRRYYDTKLGRFVGRDPISEEGGLNLYGFVGNRVADRWDALGLKYPGGLPETAEEAMNAFQAPDRMNGSYFNPDGRWVMSGEEVRGGMTLSEVVAMAGGVVVTPTPTGGPPPPPPFDPGASIGIIGEVGGGFLISGML